MASETNSVGEILKPKQSSRHSTALLDIRDSRGKKSEKVVFSLLQEKKRAVGTFKVGPSSLLQKVKEFLPQLEKANDQVQKDIVKNPDIQLKYDIENVDEANGPVIEMDLALYEDSDSSACSIESDTVPTFEPLDECNIKLPGYNPKTNLVQIVEDNQESNKN